MGLDPATVRGISNLLHGLAEKCAPRLMLGLRPQDEVPEWITHLLILANPSEILLRGTKEHIDQELDVWRGLSGGGTRPEYAQWEKKIQERLGRNVRMDRQFFFDLDIQRRINRVTLKLPAVNEGEPLIEMDGVRVQYGDKPVLGDWEEKIGRKKRHGLHWTVRRGQRWAILGANGSGKTTLLSLITSDHPQAYALPIKIFGRSRLPSPGEPAISVFELQSRMGHSSPEIHAVFPRQLTIRQAVESAFAEAFHSRPNLDCERDDDVTAALRFFKPELDVNKQASPPMTDAEVTVKRGGRPPKFDPTDPVPTGAIPTGFVPTDDDVDYADETRFGDLNTAQQRVVLLLRAIIHKPDIIILDEAFSGMPPSVRDKCIHFLEAGEQPIEKGVTARRRLSNQATWIAGHNQKKNVGRGSTKPGEAEDVDDESAMRHFGLSDRQALIVVSHVKDEIPDCVRDYLRLPSDPGDGMPLEFGQGRLRRELAISSPNTWRILWSPKLQFSNNPAGRNTKPGVEKSPTTGPNATEERSMTPDAIRMRRLRESRESTSQRVFSMTPDAVRKRKRRQLLKALREAETRQEGKV